MKYICSICGYVYDEAVSGPWADLPEGWKCPLCGAAKADFAPEGAAAPRADVTAVPGGDAEMKELSPIEPAARNELIDIFSVFFFMRDSDCGRLTTPHIFI